MDNRIVSVEPINIESLDEALRSLTANVSSTESFVQSTTVDSDNNIEETEPVPEEEPKEYTIEPNDPINVEETTLRFSSAEWFEKMKEMTITLAGLGGIGSWAAVLIGRLKPYFMYLYDGDRVESLNLAGQLYSSENLFMSKTYASGVNIAKYAAYNSFRTIDAYFAEYSHVSPIAICGFDNMAARKVFYNEWKKLYKGDKKALFIDARLAAEEFQVFCMRGNDSYYMNIYERDWLFSDEEAEETICSNKQTSFCANMVASIMTNLLVNFVTNLTNPLMNRELPFKTSYDCATMTFKIDRL